jgi:hypothetical protein
VGAAWAQGVQLLPTAAGAGAAAAYTKDTRGQGRGRRGIELAPTTPVEVLAAASTCGNLQHARVSPSAPQPGHSAATGCMHLSTYPFDTTQHPPPPLPWAAGPHLAAAALLPSVCGCGRLHGGGALHDLPEGERPAVWPGGGRGRGGAVRHRVCAEEFPGGWGAGRGGEQREGRGSRLAGVQQELLTQGREWVSKGGGATPAAACDGGVQAGDSRGDGCCMGVLPRLVQLISITYACAPYHPPHSPPPTMSPCAC